MKIVGFICLALIVCTMAFADVNAQIVKIDKDDNDNIRVWTNYKIDGVDIISKYPQIDGKGVLCSRYYVLNFAGMTDAQIKARILLDVDKHAQALNQREYIKKANNSIIDNKLVGVIGSTFKVTESDILVDTDGDGKYDKKWTVKTDGTKTISNYTDTAPVIE